MSVGVLLDLLNSILGEHVASIIISYSTRSLNLALNLHEYYKYIYISLNCKKDQFSPKRLSCSFEIIKMAKCCESLDI